MTVSMHRILLREVVIAAPANALQAVSCSCRNFSLRNTAACSAALRRPNR